jgi:hypothetical protein
MLETRLAPYAVTGNAWPNPALITISFVPDGSLISSGSDGNVYSNLFATFNSHPGWTTANWEKIILKAAQSWAQVTDINFAVIPDNGTPLGQGDYQQGDPGMGDIRIAGYDFGAGNPDLAYAYQPPPANNYSAGGDIQFNTGKPFNIGSTYDLYTVAAHEFGHALGLDESSVVSAIMYDTYVGVKNGLTGDDVAAIRSIYSNGNPRTPDAYTGNQSFATAADISSQIDPDTLTALLPNLDLTSINGSSGARTYTEVDYYTFVAPPGAGSTLTVEVQSAGLSLLAPTLTVYAADQHTVLAYVSGAGQFGATLIATIDGVFEGEQLYVKVAGAETTTLGSGQYALSLNFGSGPMPEATPAGTQLANGDPLVAGGGDPEHVASTVPENPPRAISPAFAQTAPVATIVSIANMAATPAPAAIATFILTPVPAAMLPARGGWYTSDTQAGIAPANDVPAADESSPQLAPLTGGTAEKAHDAATMCHRWLDARDTCFADSTCQSENATVASSSPMFHIPLGGSPDAAAGAAILAFVLGGYWGKQPNKTEKLRYGL